MQGTCKFYDYLLLMVCVYNMYLHTIIVGVELLEEFIKLGAKFNLYRLLEEFDQPGVVAGIHQTIIVHSHDLMYPQPLDCGSLRDHTGLTQDHTLSTCKHKFLLIG